MLMYMEDVGVKLFWNILERKSILYWKGVAMFVNV